MRFKNCDLLWIIESALLCIIFKLSNAARYYCEIYYLGMVLSGNIALLWWSLSNYASVSFKLIVL
jgi:hypothetical protein